MINHEAQAAPNGAWGTWAGLGAPAPGLAIGDPRVTNDADGRLDVYVLAKDQHVWHLAQTAPNGPWGTWATLGGPAVPIANTKRPRALLSGQPVCMHDSVHDERPDGLYISTDQPLPDLKKRALVGAP